MPKPLLVLLLTGLVCLSTFAAGSAQSFASPGGFGEEPLFERDAQESGPRAGLPPGAAQPYFSHDQVLKLGLLLAFMVGSAALAVRGKPRGRTAYLVASTAVLGLYMGGYLCPTAAVQNVFLKANTAYLLLFLVPVSGALIMGRLFCGYVCPFGALQELLHVRRWAVRIPERSMRALGGLRYVLLLYLIARVLVTHRVILSDFSPFKPLFAWGGTTATISFTALVAALSIVVFRPFCRVLCPYGALLSLVSRLSLFRLRADSRCVHCNLCTPACPAGCIRGGSVDTTECLLCGACAGRCGPHALRLTRRPWRRRPAKQSAP